MAIKERLTKNQKIASIIVIILFAAVIIYSIATMIYRIGKTKVIINIAPRSAQITINDSHVGNNTTLWLAHGSYHLKAEGNEHLNTYETDFIVADETIEIYTILNSTDEEGEKYISDHQQEYTNVEGLISEQDDKYGQKLKDKYPILKHIPINNSLYSISYKYENDEPIITIKADEEFIDTAVERLKTFDDITLSQINFAFSITSPYQNYQQNPLTNPKEFIRAAYQLSNDYVIAEPQKIDDYYYTTISKIDHDDEIAIAHYRIIIKSIDNSWHILNTPQPILTIYNTTNIPESVLNATNSY